MASQFKTQDTRCEPPTLGVDIQGWWRDKVYHTEAQRREIALGLLEVHPVKLSEAERLKYVEDFVDLKSRSDTHLPPIGE